MRSFIAFLRKEILDQVRSGKAAVIGILFILFGIMNPAIAKMTPWLLEMMADSLAESGMSITLGEVTALDSWMQFFKNMPLALIAFILLQSSIFTKEYSSATLVLSLTKGLERYKVVVSKALILTVLFSIGYWICFGITYGYTAYFWDNSIVSSLIPAVIYWWLFGMLTIAVMTLFSCICTTNSAVLLCTGGFVLVSYVIGLFPKLCKYTPTYLMSGSSLIYGLSEASDYVSAVIITAVMILICIALSIPVFNKKQI